MMRAVLPVAGRAVVREIPRPIQRDGHVIMRVLAAAINRADVLQVGGHYPPPKGVTEVLGLEAAGVLPDGSIGAALVAGGALAEYLSVPVGNIMKIPSLSSNPVQLAAVPEAFLVAHHLLFQCGGFDSGQSVIINAAGSGVGTACIQLAKSVPNTTVFASARGPAKRAYARELGADVIIDPRASPRELSDTVKKVTEGKGADLVLDAVGAEAFRENARSLRMDGTLVQYGLLSGAKSADLSLAPLLMRRIKLVGTTLRSRDDSFKRELVNEFIGLHAHKFEAGKLHPVVARTYEGLERTEEALEYMRSNENVGKIVVATSPYTFESVSSSSVSPGGGAGFFATLGGCCSSRLCEGTPVRGATSSLRVLRGVLAPPTTCPVPVNAAAFVEDDVLMARPGRLSPGMAEEAD